VIWRVIVHWSYSGLTFMSERGARAQSAGQALDAVLASVRADRADSYRSFAEPARKLSCFSHEASLLPLVNGRGETVQEAFE
jgi:hypothetical protein